MFFILVRVAVIKIATNAGDGVGGTPHTCQWNVTCSVTLKITQRKLTPEPQCDWLITAG